jgi:hypothetical protein
LRRGDERDIGDGWSKKKNTLPQYVTTLPQYVTETVLEKNTHLPQYNRFMGIKGGI